jgi:hypothetical protein
MSAILTADYPFTPTKFWENGSESGKRHALKDHMMVVGIGIFSPFGLTIITIKPSYKYFVVRLLTDGHYHKAFLQISRSAPFD